MSTTCRLFSQDILTPEPDWDAIAVYSDYLEDDGRPNRLALATILRWLRTYNHWPNYEDILPLSWEIYCKSESSTEYYPQSRYVDREKPSYVRPLKDFSRATLPPYFFTPFQQTLDPLASSNYTLCFQGRRAGLLFSSLLRLNHLYPTLFISDPTPYLLPEYNKP